MQKISVNLTTDCDGNQLNCNNDCNLKQELCTTETFWNRFFDSNWQHKTPTVIRHLLSSPRQPTTLWFCTRTFFYVKLFAIIILSWNSFKCILWHLLELSDPFIKNENLVLPILIEKNFEQKCYFCISKMRSIFLKKGNLNFSIKLGQRLPKSFSQVHVKNSRFFLSYFLKKDDWPKAYAGPMLPTLPYFWVIFLSSVFAQSHYILLFNYFWKL